MSERLVSDQHFSLIQKFVNYIGPRGMYHKAYEIVICRRYFIIIVSHFHMWTKHTSLPRIIYNMTVVSFMVQTLEPNFIKLFMSVIH
jgi:hypothetical protein